MADVVRGPHAVGAASRTSGCTRRVRLDFPCPFPCPRCRELGPPKRPLCGRWGVEPSRRLVRLSDGGTYFIHRSAEPLQDQPLVPVVDIQHARQHVRETGHKLTSDKNAVGAWVALHVRAVDEGGAVGVVLDRAEQPQRPTSVERVCRTPRAQDGLSALSSSRLLRRERGHREHQQAAGVTQMQAGRHDLGRNRARGDVGSARRDVQSRRMVPIVAAGGCSLTDTPSGSTLQGADGLHSRAQPPGLREQHHERPRIQPLTRPTQHARTFQPRTLGGLPGSHSFSGHCRHVGRTSASRPRPSRRPSAPSSAVDRIEPG